MILSLELRYLIITILAFMLGGFFGWFIRGILDKKHTSPNAESAFIVSVVVSIWAVSVIVDIIDPGYDTSPLLYGIMGAIVGFFFKPWSGKNIK